MKRRPVSSGPAPAAASADVPAAAKRLSVPREYLSLHKYLDNRFADTVVLTFGEIEDLLGFRLPDPARLQLEWWANRGADGTSSAQSCSWIQASRIATANLQARTVAFERISA
jgi:hypothetical protein